jgi:hypothetical protein
MPNNFLLIIIFFFISFIFFCFFVFLDPFNNCVVRAAEPIESHRDPPENWEYKEQKNSYRETMYMTPTNVSS